MLTTYEVSPKST